jgi:DtxR family Mn-dependent transcriptional regulator
MAELSNEVSENYLKHIYRLSLERRPVKTSRLAEALCVSPATVTEMLQRLSEQQFVDYTPYQGVQLTELGHRRALLVLRRHRLWEVFLERVLGLPWQRVHAHAERLEHATDDELANYLDDFLGNPRVGPHGQPVPTRDGTVTEVERLRLTELVPGQTVELIQIEDESPAVLDHLGELGLMPGVRVRVVTRAPLDGPLRVEVGDATVDVGPAVAAMLIVRVTADA